MGGFQVHQPKGWMIRLQFCRPSQVQVLRPKVPMRIMQCTWRLQTYEAPMDPCSPRLASHLRIKIKSLSCCSVQQSVHTSMQVHSRQQDWPNIHVPVPSLLAASISLRSLTTHRGAGVLNTIQRTRSILLESGNGSDAMLSMWKMLEIVTSCNNPPTTCGALGALLTRA